MVCSFAKRRLTSPRDAKIMVRQEPDGWAVSSEGSAIRFAGKREALAAARKAVADQGGKVVVHDRRGRTQETLTLGAQIALRMNAVEGLVLDQSSRRIVRMIKRQSLTSAQARVEILHAFKKTRP